MTWGLLLILIGVELNLVDSFRVDTARHQTFGRANLSSGPFEDVLVRKSARNCNPETVTRCRGSRFPTSTQQRRAGFASNSTSFPYSTPNYRRTYEQPIRRNSADRIQQPENRVTDQIPESVRNAGYASNYSSNEDANSRFGGQKMITPPSWFCWPPIFLGAVLFPVRASSNV